MEVAVNDLYMSEKRIILLTKEFFSILRKVLNGVRHTVNYTLDLEKLIEYPLVLMI